MDLCLRKGIVKLLQNPLYAARLIIGDSSARPAPDQKMFYFQSQLLDAVLLASLLKMVNKLCDVS